MKVLFTALHFANYRNFESVVRDLAERGHQVHLLADERENFGGQALVERLAAEYPSITWSYTPVPDVPWFPVAQKGRLALDYVRFLAPRYAAAAKLRQRNIERTPRIVRWTTSGVGGALIGYQAVAAALKAAERMLPPSDAITRIVAEQRPDVVLLTGLTVSRTFAMEQLKAARALGIPAAACIMSWDHLSSKALMHVHPDATLVWNDVQKQEAVEMHGIPAESVVITGAQCYDQWFDRRPVRSREEFCRDVGLDPSRPFVLYVCSAMSPVPDPVEPVFVKEWIQALRSSGEPALRDAGVLVRPHPERVREWNGVSLDDLENVVVNGRNPIDAEAKADYFDALYYSAAVVGLCTTVFLEAAIIGRPVLTLQLPAYRMHQDGMLHFRYLLEVEGGLLHTSPDLTSHVAQLADALRGGTSRDERNRRFIAAFVRPQGLGVPSTPRFVEAIERLATGGRREPDPRMTRPSAARTFVTRLASAGTHGVGAWLLMDSVDEQRVISERGRAQQKHEVLSDRAARYDAERRERDRKLWLSRQERRAKERLGRLKERRRAREAWIRRMRHRARTAVSLVRQGRYVVATSRPVERLKVSLRLLFGARHQ